MIWFIVRVAAYVLMPNRLIPAQKYKIAELKRKVQAGIADRHIVEERSRLGGKSAQQEVIRLEQHLEEMSIELKALLTQVKQKSPHTRTPGLARTHLVYLKTYTQMHSTPNALSA